jgi:hypothetical protein
MAKNHSGCQSPRLWLEAFVLVNLLFLGPDIYLAHSTNSFHHPAEYLPLYFSLGAPVLLFVALVAEAVRLNAPSNVGWPLMLWRSLGFLVGSVSAVLGVTGLILHLESHFFREQTLDSLVYTAPFAAPLAYTGLGLLLIMNRTVAAESAEWPCWVILLALGGFVGNFIFSLADHAQNGFFHWTEWIPVASSAFAIAFLLIPFVILVNRRYVGVCTLVMAVQVGVGLLGCYLHTSANLHGPSSDMLNNFVYGAPVLAPLLFPNLALLALIGLWDLRTHLR